MKKRNLEWADTNAAILLNLILRDGWHGVHCPLLDKTREDEVFDWLVANVGQNNLFHHYYSGSDSRHGDWWFAFKSKKKAALFKLMFVGG